MIFFTKLYPIFNMFNKLLQKIRAYSKPFHKNLCEIDDTIHVSHRYVYH